MTNFLDSLLRHALTFAVVFALPLMLVAAFGLLKGAELAARWLRARRMRAIDAWHAAVQRGGR